MAQQLAHLDDRLIAFVQRQHVFFVASAAPEGRVNVSPKGLPSLRVMGPDRIGWLDLTGSGSETAAHLKASDDARLPVMFCAFEGPPLILRLYGRGTAHMRGTPTYRDLIGSFEASPGEEPLGSRQIVVLDIDMVQTSCGFAVPLFAYEGDRDTLTRWAAAKGADGLQAYWREKNMTSIDGLPTGFDPEVMRRG